MVRRFRQIITTAGFLSESSRKGKLDRGQGYRVRGHDVQGLLVGGDGVSDGDVGDVDMVMLVM